MFGCCVLNYSCCFEI